MIQRHLVIISAEFLLENRRVVLLVPGMSAAHSFDAEIYRLYFKYVCVSTNVSESIEGERDILTDVGISACN